MEELSAEAVVETCGLVELILREKREGEELRRGKEEPTEDSGGTTGRVGGKSQKPKKPGEKRAPRIRRWIGHMREGREVAFRLETWGP